jgi:hypothetical protein
MMSLTDKLITLIWIIIGCVYCPKVKMAYDQDLAQKIKDFIDGIPGITEKKIFEGIGFMLNGNMVCGVNK